MFVIVFICALIGLWIRGATGFFVGGAVGFVLTTYLRAAAHKRLAQVQTAFLDTTFSVMGALCKADGVVTREEIQVAEQIFARLRLSEEQKRAAKVAFNRGKADDFDLDATVRQFARSAPPSPLMFHMFLRLQLIAIAADGRVHPAEHEMLVRVARGLGLSEFHVVQLEAMLRAAAEGPASARVSQEQRLEDAYATLGVTPEASETEIKRAYRKLIIDNHPDRVAAKGLPESMREIAEERAREINAAYDVIKKARRFT